MTMFPDVEMVLLELLEAFVADEDHIGTYTDANLANLLPFIQVQRFGGFDDGRTDDAAVDIDCFAATRAAAIDLARQIHEFLTSGPHWAAGVAIDRVTTSVGPVERPRAAGNIRRFGGTYTISCRRVVPV